MGPIVLTVEGDADPLAFNSLVDFLLPGGVGLLELVLGGGATWLSVGSVVPISADSFELVTTNTRVEISFSPREFIGVDLGDVGGGTDWLIGLTGVDGPFTLSIGIVPGPASLALLLAGIGRLGAPLWRIRPWLDALRAGVVPDVGQLKRLSPVWRRRAARLFPEGDEAGSRSTPSPRAVE